MKNPKLVLRRWAAVLIGVALVAADARAAVVTRRLGTGLSASGSGGPLPEAWVAPVETAPIVDGRLREEAWSATRPVLLGRLESRGQTSPRSQVRLVHKAGVLYVGVELSEPNVGKMRRAVTQRDGPAYQDDSVELFLSPDPSRGYFQLIISATGAIYDRQNRGDPGAWNSGAKAAVAVGKEGWSAEIAVPMASLDVGQQVPRRWRANFYRNRYAGPEGQNQAWSPTFRSDYDVPQRFGHLLFTPTSPWGEQEQTARKQRGISVEQIGSGGAVLSFDLCALPEGTKIYRAGLLCERRPIDGGEPQPPGEIEIYPLRAAYEKGTAPKTEGTPLGLIGPWYRSFEMTQLVRDWVGGRRPNLGLYVKTFPGWRTEKTYLDLMYEGQPGDVPPQVTGLRAFCRAGQTFLTWKEIDDPVGQDEITWGPLKAILDGLDRQREIRYCVYRGRRPITAENLHEAEQIAVVRPLSCWNLSGRNVARPIDRFIATAEVLNWHQWNPFRDATIDGDYGRDCPIDRFVIRQGQAPLARGTGLYVHTAARNENVHYAVVTRVDGVENTIHFGPGNSLAGPVEEAVADPEPVLQGELPKMPFFNYDQRRLHYVRWPAPPLTNKPYDYYNWSVGVPNRLGKGVPLELNLHRDGYAYWRTHYRIEPGSIVLCPHDFPLRTWWYGYHEAHGTLRPWTGGVIRNYTEKRLLWFVDWAARKWPVDRNRILVTGCNGGASGSGALHLGLRYPELFNMVVSGHGQPEYTAVASQVENIWGKVEWGLKSETGRKVWEELDLVRHVRALPAKVDLPFVSMTYSNRQETAEALAQALTAARQPVITHTAWGGQRLIPVSATATTPWCVRLDVRRNRSLLAVGSTGKVGDAIRNGSLLWHSEGLVDQPDRYTVTLRQTSGSFEGTITLRRLQRFRAGAGKTYVWKLEPLETPGTQSRGMPETQEGQITVANDGLLTIRGAKMAAGTYRLTITPK